MQYDFATLKFIEFIQPFYFGLQFFYIHFTRLTLKLMCFILFFFIFNLYFICCLQSIREYYYKKIVHYMKWSREGRKNYNQLYSSIKTNERSIQFKMNLLGELNWNKNFFLYLFVCIDVCTVRMPLRMNKKKKLNKKRL